jgi:hypothetical protein
MRSHQHVDLVAHAWDEAVSTLADLARGCRFRPVDVHEVRGMLRAPDEYVVRVFTAGSMRFERLLPVAVRYMRRRPVFVAGPPKVVGTVVLASLLQDAAVRRRLEREPALQWCEVRLVSTVVTTHRLLCLVVDGGRYQWRRFSYDAISGFGLTADVLELTFLPSDSGEAVEPLRLRGPWAPWCAAAIAHFRYGRDARAAVPSLAACLPVA